MQGLTNGVLTTVIGYQTIKYLNEEYKLQDILDGVEIEETEEEFKQTCNELEQELKVIVLRVNIQVAHTVLFKCSKVLTVFSRNFQHLILEPRRTVRLRQ